MTSPALTPDQETEVKARANYGCQREYTGCTHTADLVELVYAQNNMEYIKRDPNSPDNWFSVCTNCFDIDQANPPQ